MKQICLLSYYCGFRRSEIVPLLWEQVHLDGNYIQLYQTKSGRPRKVIITREARKILKPSPRKTISLAFSPTPFSDSLDRLIS